MFINLHVHSAQGSLLDSILNVKDIAKYAGKVMLKYFNQENGEKYKGDRTIVTLADTEINSYLISLRSYGVV